MDRIIEKPKVVDFLRRRNLLKMYMKNKNLLLEGYCGKLDFKLRKPTSSQIYSFRINKKYRAFGKLIDRVLVIYHIDDHQ